LFFFSQEVKYSFSQRVLKVLFSIRPFIGVPLSLRLLVVSLCVSHEEQLIEPQPSGLSKAYEVMGLHPKRRVAVRGKRLQQAPYCGLQNGLRKALII
jgi:hypothetical protein